MSVIVVATIAPKPGRLQEVVDAMAVTVPLVHAEPGCELYSVQTDGGVIIMIERWASREALDVHSQGDALKRFGELAGAALAAPPAVVVTENVPFGDPLKGVIQ